MARDSGGILLRETWADFPAGLLLRDNTARGEYMAMVVGENPGGWYHNAKAGNCVDRDHSPLSVRKAASGKVLEVPATVSPWGPLMILTPGPRPWRDYTVSTTIRIKDRRCVGLVTRYQTNRDCYAAVFESGVFKLVRVLEGTITILASAAYRPGRAAVRVSVQAQGDTITARAGSLRLTARDGCIRWGGIGLWANGAATFGAVVVKAGRGEVRRLEQAERRDTVRVARKQSKLPKMELVAEVDVRGHALGRQIRFGDLNGDGRQELLFAVPTVHRGRRWRYNRIAQLSALNLDGRVLWRRGQVKPDSLDITADLPFQVADRGRGVEVVAAFGPSLEVLDPLTGKQKQRTLTPVPPKMEPYWDEISTYWGDGHGDDLPRLIVDSLRLCNFTGRHAYGDLLIKDRYHNAWALDGRTLKILWHHRCNTGHYPFAVDFDGDGIDEVLLGYSRLNSRGELIGRLVLGDHPDACFSYVDEAGRRHNLHPCGEAGFVAECDGRVSEVHLGHVQHLSVGNFVANRPGLERIIVTYHGNQGIIALLDSDNCIIRKIERYAAGAVCQPVNWTGDGRELIAFSPRHGDGGLWDEHFDLVVPFPSDDHPGKYMEVRDVLGWGVDQVVVWDERRLHVYAPAVRPNGGSRRYDPVRPEPNMSNYQVNYSLPRWT